MSVKLIDMVEQNWTVYSTTSADGLLQNYYPYHKD